MKRVKIVLAAAFVILLAFVLLRKDGMVRTFIAGLSGPQAMAQPEQSGGNAPAQAPAAQPATEVQTAPATETAAKPDSPAAEAAKPMDSKTDAAAAPAADTPPAAEADKTDAAAASADAAEPQMPSDGDPNRPDRGRFGPRSGRFDPEMMQRFTEAGGDPNRPFDRDRIRDMMSRYGDRGRRGPGSETPDGQSAVAAAPGEDPMEAINLNGVEMKKIIQTLGEWTGKPIIPTSDEIMNTRITIYATKQVPRSQAMALILAALKAKGVILEQSEDKILLKPIASAKLGSVPTLSPDEPLARITDKAQIVEKFFRLENYSPSKIMTIITPLIAEYGHVTAMEDTGQIAVIDSVENLVRVERIIRQLDVPESEQVVEEIFTLENGDPIEIVQVLELILDTERRSRSRDYGRPPQQGGSGPSAPSGAKSAASVVVTPGEIPVRLIPIPKNNWIIARAALVDMEQIRSWIKKLDHTETVQSEQTIVQVKYVDVREVAGIIDETLRDMPGTDFQTSVVVQPLTQAKQIVIFGSAENRKMVEKLIAEIDLPLRDMYKEKTFKLKYADPDQIKLNIDGLYGDSSMNSRGGYNPYGGYSSYNRYGRTGTGEDEIVKVISYPTQQQVTVIASEKNLAKIERQITEEWDVPIDIEKDQYRILTLHNSDPVQMSNLLTKLFSEEGGDGSRDIIRMIFGGQSDSQKKIVGSLYGMLTFEPVPDTKKIIIISKIPEAYDVIEKLVNDLDSEEKAEVPRVITLNYADAEDLCDQLNAILNEPGTLATLQRSTRGLSAYSADAESATGGGGQTGGGGETGGGTITPWWTRQRTSVDEEMPTSNLIGQVRFVPVARSKAVLVLAPPEYITDIEKMIAALDQPGMQVMIKIVIVEVDHSTMTSLGVQLTSNPALFNNIGANAFRALTELTTGYGNGRSVQLPSTGSNSVTRQPFAFSAGLNIDVLIEALTKTIDAKILNQPTLWTKDNQEAIFKKGQRVAFIENSSADRQNTGQITTTYSYDDVGLTLRVRPNITPEKAVDLSIQLIVSQVGENVNNQLATNQLDTTTNVIVNDGQTILLGGILFQNDNVVVNKVPLLGDVPLLGGLFRHTSDTLRNNELLAFVTPYVVDANSLNAIPADLDDTRQLMEPRQRMDTIRNELDGAMDWMSDEIIKEIEEAKPFNKNKADDTVEIKPQAKPVSNSLPGRDHDARVAREDEAARL